MKTESKVTDFWMHQTTSALKCTTVSHHFSKEMHRTVKTDKSQ